MGRNEWVQCGTCHGWHLLGLRCGSFVYEMREAIVGYDGTIPFALDSICYCSGGAGLDGASRAFAKMRRDRREF